jgi:hypothetical protein
MHSRDVSVAYRSKKYQVDGVQKFTSWRILSEIQANIQITRDTFVHLKISLIHQSQHSRKSANNFKTIDYYDFGTFLMIELKSFTFSTA